MVAATPAVVFQIAADVYRKYGYEFPTPKLGLLTQAEAHEIAYPNMEDPIGSATQGEIFLTQDTISDLILLSKVASKPTQKLRIAAYRSCDFRCTTIVHTVMHEMAHQVQFKYGMSGTIAHIEGTADAVAYDLDRVLVWCLIGPKAPVKGYWQPDLRYPKWAITVRKVSAAVTKTKWPSPAGRWWRFKELAK